MTISKEQIQSLMQYVEATSEDPLDCDGCFGRIGEFAELHLAGKTVPDAMRCIEAHLRNCPCCKDEFNCLLEALEEMRS